MRESLIAGQYLLIEQVGRGGFAVVWRARDERLRRDVAVKQLFVPPHLTEEQRHAHRERTLREARSAARLSHPGVVTVHDVVEHDGFPWIVMEYVPGRTLGQIVRADGPLPPARVAEIGLSLLDALCCAHEAGVLHRDVKPSNVIVGERRVVLGDFGIARVEGDEDDLTQSGIVMGAPSYTAPERARGEPAVAASDLWSLGATMFYAVEGRRAFAGPNPNATFHAILTRDTPPAHRAGPLAPVIEGLLRKDLTARMTAEEAAVLLAGAVRTREAAPLSVRVAAAFGEARWPDGRRSANPRRSTDRRREETGPIPGVAAPRHAPARLGHRRPGRVRPAAGRGPRRPPLAVAALTALTLLLLGTALRVDDPRRPAASYRRPSLGPRLAATLPTGRGEILSVAFSPDGRTLATGGRDHSVRLWNVAGHRAAGTLAGHRRPVSTTAFSPDGRTLATGAYDGKVILWTGPAHRRATTLDTHGHAIGALAFGPEGRTLAAAGDAVRRWRLGRRTARPLPTPARTPLTTAPRGRAVTTAGTSAAGLWWPGGHAPPAAVAVPAAIAGGMAFSADGRTLATGGDGRAVRLWDVTRHRLTATVPAPGGRVTALAFSPDGRTLACAGDRAVLLWNLRAHSPVTRLITRARTVEAVAFSPDGHTLATAGDDAFVRLWRLR